MEKTKRIPFLLGVTLYGLLILLIIMLFGLILVLVNLSQFNFLHENYSLQSSEYASLTLVYLPLLFILLSIYSVIQMIRRKWHARYLFIFLSILLMAFLLWQNSLDGLNLLFVILINIILIIHPSWFRKELRKSSSKTGPNELKNEENLP